MKIYISHSNKFNYFDELYIPLLNSKIKEENELIFPHSKELENVDTKEILASCDVLIAEISNPAIGVGIEIGRAEACNLKIICLLKNGVKCNSSVKRVADNIIKYNNIQEMINKLEKGLKEYK